MMQPRFGILTDDLSGGMNIGVEFSGAGMQTLLVQDVVQPGTDSQVLIFNTETRNAPPEMAYKKVLTAAQELRRYAPLIVVKKIDSLLRGGIGQEIAAVVDAFAFDKCLLVAASPKMGRTTLKGQQYIENHLLETVRQQVDPTSTVEGSDVQAILRSQAALPLDLIDIDVVRQGTDAIQARIRESDACILVADCAMQEDLNTVVEAAYVAGVRFFAGTYGMGEALTQLFNAPRSPLLFVVGSLSTAAYQQVFRLREELPCQHIQIEYTESFLDDPVAVFAAQYRSRFAEAMQQSEYIILQLATYPEQVEQLWGWAAQRGLSRGDVSARIAGLLHEIVGPVPPPVRGCVATGGATAHSLFALMQAEGLRLEAREVLPGTPGARIVGGLLDGCPFVAKPGSQGGEDALIRLAQYVNEASQSS